MKRFIQMKKCGILSLSFFFAVNISAQLKLPSDKNATKETINLYCNLKKLLDKGFMFGHQDDLAYGVGWKYENTRSDVKDVTGDYPAVYGWELGHLEIDKLVNLDSVPFNRMQEFIKQGYERGGIITISWHLNNPLTGKSAWDPAEGTVSSILPEGDKHELFKSWLDKVAHFLQGLKGKHGEMIPVIFRPFHELNGSWFWWGKNHCTPEEFKSLWQFVVAYLRDQKNIHHLLYAFNTDKFYSKEEYLERYPGNEWVDIIGFDIYQREMNREMYMKTFDNMLTMLEAVAKEKNKIPALTEFGGDTADPDWWTGTFLKVMENHKISYVLGWRNAGKKPSGEFEFYVPYKGNMAEENFNKFYKDKGTLFQGDVTREKLYK